MAMKATEFIEHFTVKHQGQETVFIIGGGPSVLKVLPDTHVLDGKNVIATNNAYQIFPDAMFVWFADRTWYMWHRDNELKNFKNPIASPAAANEPQRKDFHQFGVTPFGHGDRNGGFSIDKTKVNGNNAGHQAINVAANIGFKNIILLGFDMNPVDPKTHWHSGHRRPTNRDNYKNTMIPGMEKMVPFQEQLGFKVYNTNPESHLKCFEFTDINKWL